MTAEQSPHRSLQRGRWGRSGGEAEVQEEPTVSTVLDPE